MFAKAPVAGLAKTRLIPALGAEGAARLHAGLVERTLRTALAAAAARVELWCAPDCSHPFFAGWASRGVKLHAQPEGDLGERMAAFFRAAPEHGPALLIGCDCPSLTPADLREAERSLREGADAVFVPVHDGGYVLVGLSRFVPQLFADMPWSTSEVMALTRARLAAAGLRWIELPMRHDIDRPEDLRRLSNLPAAVTDAQR